MNYNEEQKKGIFTPTKNILISAGAGSGKTAVLTQRIIEKFKDGIKPDQLLVLTFTREAASELKQRIKKKILEEKTIKDLYYEIDSANIGTFDSFALEICQKYHYLLNLDQDISVILNELLVDKQKEIMNDIFLNRLDDYDFKDFLYKYTKKNYGGMLDDLIKIAKEMDKYFDRNDYLNHYFDNNYQDANVLLKKYEECIYKYGLELQKDIDETYTYYADDGFGSSLLVLRDFFDEKHNYTEYKNFSLDFKFGRVKSKKDELNYEYIDNLKDNVKKNYKKLADNYLIYQDVDEIRNGFEEEKKIAKTFIDILKEFFNRCDDYKKDQNCYTFGDIAKFAYQIVLENENVRKELQEKYQEILIDEYQDTSNNQEEFIKLIAKDNVYQVGDIKQSIYRFRDANPYNFKKKYEEYLDENLDGFGFKIDMINNFRSRKEVLHSINQLFGLLMTDKCGDAKYQDNHQMHFGNKNYEIERVHDFNYQGEFLRFDYDKSDEIKADDIIGIESLIICKKIKELVDNKFQVFDKEEQKLRDIRYSDIAVITRRNKCLEEYAKCFGENQIPFDIIMEINIKNNVLYADMVNLINLISNGPNNEYYPYYFQAVGRSFILELDDNLLLEYHFDKYQNNEITKKALEIKEYSKYNSPSKTLDKMIVDFDIYHKIARIGSVNENIKVLEHLMSLIEGLANLGYNFNQIANLLEKSLSEELDIKYKIESLHQGVQLLNIHQSKGLEYPICFFPDLTSDFNEKELKEKYIFNHDLGFISPYYLDDKIKNNIDKIIHIEDIKDKRLSEYIRLLYVAITRTREKFYLLWPNNGDKKEKFNIKDSKSFYDFINLVKDDLSFKETKYEYHDFSTNGLSNKIIYQAFGNDNDFVFKEKTFEPKVVTKGKISKEFIKIKDQKAQELLDLGTSLHEILEIIDLKTKDLSNLKIDDTKKQIIEKVLNLDIFKDLENTNVYQEHEFYYEDNGSSFHGIIDLLLEKADKFIIIDYKLYNTDKEEYERQLGVYKRYLELISNKPIELYLLSLIKGELKEVKLS